MQQEHYFYKRNLPHYQPPQGEFFVTFRLVNSLPKEVIGRWQKEKARTFGSLKPNVPRSIIEKVNKYYFNKFDQLLDTYSNGEFWLNDDRIAQIIANKLHEFDGYKYVLICYCCMPNHVHLLFKLLHTKRDKSRSTFPVTNILRLIKGATAFKANKIIKRNGQFWQHESYDHLVRSDVERANIIRYILENPVKAGLATYWTDWKWSYCKKIYLKSL